MSRALACLALWLVGLLVVPADNSAHAAVPKHAAEVRDILSQPFKFSGVDDPKVTLTDVLEMLSKQVQERKCVKLTFNINENAFKTEQVTDVGKSEVANPSLPPMNVSLDTVLKKVLSRIPVDSGATYVIRADTIEITTNAAVLAEFYAPGVREPRFPLVIAGFENTPLDEAVRELAKQTGKNLILDARFGKDARVPVTGDFMNVPLDEAVFLLADMANLASVRINPATLYITSPKNAKAVEKRQQQEQ